MSANHITTSITLVPSLYGYPLVEVEIGTDSRLVVKNKCVNYGVVDGDFFVVMDDVDSELDSISKDFELFVYAIQESRIDFNRFQFSMRTPNLEDEDVTLLESGKAYLLIFSQVDQDTMYVNR